MGRQTGFFTLEEDERVLLRICEQHGMRAIPAEIPTGSAIEPEEPLTFERPPGALMFCLLPATVPISAAVFERMADPSRSVLMPHKSAALQFVPCRSEGRGLDDGRIYFDTPRVSPWFDNVRRDFERLSRFIKRWAPTDQFRFHVGPAAAAAVRAGQLHLKHARYELRPV